MFTCMAMKLDDREKPDLTTWKDIQKNLFHIENPSDYIVFHSLSTDSSDVFSASDRLLNLNDVKNNQDEKLMIRAFDLIASLTKRIASKDFHPEDSNIYFVIAELLKNLVTIFQNEELATAITTEAAMKQVKNYKPAELINSQIHKYMMNYFKL